MTIDWAVVSYDVLLALATVVCVWLSLRRWS